MLLQDGAAEVTIRNWFVVAGITINSNIASLNAQRRLSTSTSELRDSFASLSSGLRINKASDDAAGLAISSSLNIDKRVFDQGVRNLNDGMSLLSIAEGAVEQLSTIAIRLTELAEQAANGALQTTQRKALNAEAQALKNEFKRISQSTQFNGQNLFSGALGNVRLQTGFGSNASLQSNLGGAVGVGDFQSGSTALSISGGGTNVKVADFNGDGLADVLGYGGNLGNGTIGVGLGNGQGGFTTVYSGTFTNSGGSSSGVAIGDINNDGKLDVIAAANSVGRILLGNGNGTFAASGSFSDQLGITGDATLADLNNDGFLDLGFTGTDGFSDAVTFIMLGNGNGTFRAGTSFNNTFSGGETGFGLQFADLNGDGKLDMFNSIDRDSNNGGIGAVRLGDGTGNFGTATLYNVANVDAFHSTLADMNNDGKLDYVVAGNTDGLGSIFIGFGDGRGNFGNAVTLEMWDSGGLSTLAVADFNGDGNMDVIGDAFLALGNGNGTFTSIVTLSVPQATVRDLALGDINGDGVQDLLAANILSGNIVSYLSRTTTGIAPLQDFSLLTLADARQALPVFRQKVDLLTKQRGTIGAFQSRIETAVSNTATISLNVASAASQITNADVAEVTAKLLKQRILQQVGTSVLAQANQGPALALKLLDIS